MATSSSRISASHAPSAMRSPMRVLLTPGRSGVSSLVWTLPAVALVLAVVGLAFAFRRWRGGGHAHASDADRELVDRARAGADP